MKFRSFPKSYILDQLPGHPRPPPHRENFAICYGQGVRGQGGIVLGLPVQALEVRGYLRPLGFLPRTGIVKL